MAAAPGGNIWDGSVYAVFKSNKKLGGDFDQFERDHEPLMQVRAYEQQFHVASYKLNEALKKLEPLVDTETLPRMAEVKPEIEHHRAMITDAKGLKARAKKGLDRLKYLSTKADQEGADMRKKLSDHIASVFPAVKEDLIRIKAHISGEVTRLTQENGKLHREIATLISSAGTADSVDQLKTYLADELKRAEAISRQDTEEVKRLRKIEVNYLADEKSWDREKKRLEDELDSKIAALDKVQRGKAQQEAENARLARELREQRSLTKEANDKLQYLEVQKETVDGKLADALEKARGEEFRANGLSLDLENALETCRERQEKIDTLTSRLEAPRPVDADGKARIAMRAMQTEIDTHLEKTEKWKRQIQQAKDAQSSAETKLSQSEEQVKTLKGDVAIAEADKILLNDQIKQLTNDSETSPAEIAKLHSVISEKNSNIGKLERQLQRMTNDFEWAKLRWNEYYGLQYRSTQEIQQLQITNKEFLESWESKCEELREQKFLTNQANNKLQHLESQKGSVQAELQKAREEVITAEQQLTDAKLAWEEEKVELHGAVELWKNVAADKDDTIRKLEKKIQKMDMEFEWVKGRSLEYYGSLQIANQDNQTLQGGIDELCKVLDEMKAEMQKRAAEDIARDEAIIQMVQATKVLDSMRTSRPTSVASGMDWESSLSRSGSRLGQSLDPFSASRQYSPVRRTESLSSQSASKRRRSMGSQMDEDSSTALPNSSEVPTPGELSTAFLNPSTSFNKPSANVWDEQDSTDSDTTPRRAPHTRHLGGNQRSMIPVPVGRVSSSTEKSSSTLPSPLASAGRGQMMTPGGFGPSNSSGFSDQTLRSSTYTSPYLRGPSPTTPGGNITTGIGSLGIGGFQVPGTPRSQSTTNAGTVGHGASGQSPASVGTSGQGLSTQSSPTAGTFGPALPQPVVRRYSFLISGDVPTGTRTMAVDPSIIEMMDDQVVRWENNTAWATSWKANTSTSRRRCSETRVLGLNRQRSPYVDNPTTACAYCVKSGKLCVINGVHGLVVIPLPVSERSANATPLAGNFFVKRRYTFLVGGHPTTGPRTSRVDPAIIQMMDAQIARWNANSNVNWAGSSAVSHKRCSETRVQQFKRARNPPASENPNEACAHCVANKILCVLVVGVIGPVVVPLPVSDRSPGATPTNGEYYVKA